MRFVRTYHWYVYVRTDGGTDPCTYSSVVLSTGGSTVACQVPRTNLRTYPRGRTGTYVHMCTTRVQCSQGTDNAHTHSSAHKAGTPCFFPLHDKPPRPRAAAAAGKVQGWPIFRWRRQPSGAATHTTWQASAMEVGRQAVLWRRPPAQGQRLRCSTVTNNNRSSSSTCSNSTCRGVRRERGSGTITSS